MKLILSHQHIIILHTFGIVEPNNNIFLNDKIIFIVTVLDAIGLETCQFTD